MDQFTPMSALIGGALIGLSAALLLAALGRVAGISGILAGSLSPSDEGWDWRITFLVGLIAGCALVQGTAVAAPIHMVVGKPALVLAGALVGLGTRLGNGCTSGHGVCGLARLSPRSLAATMTFMLCGGLTVYVLRHVVGG